MRKDTEMGDRSLIVIESESLTEPVWLYGHYAGEDNLVAVKSVLARTDRLGDPSYLTAQLFYEFAVTLGGYDGNLGFGIGTGSVSLYEGDNPTVYLNADTGVYSHSYEDYAKAVTERLAEMEAEWRAKRHS